LSEIESAKNNLNKIFKRFRIEIDLDSYRDIDIIKTNSHVLNALQEKEDNTTEKIKLKIKIVEDQIRRNERLFFGGSGKSYKAQLKRAKKENPSEIIKLNTLKNELNNWDSGIVFVDIDNIIKITKRERLEKERLEIEKLEKESSDKIEQLEQDRFTKEITKQKRIDKERLEKERLEKERLFVIEKEIFKKTELENQEYLFNTSHHETVSSLLDSKTIDTKDSMETLHTVNTIDNKIPIGLGGLVVTGIIAYLVFKK
jgi:hypothetical protein